MERCWPGRRRRGRASRAGGLAAADAIRTTDTVAKIAFQRADGYTIGGMAKGAGMLAPALATMLCVLTTDADLAPADLDAALRAAHGSRSTGSTPRLHVHQRHRAAARQRRGRGPAGPGDFTRVLTGSAPISRASCRRTPKGRARPSRSR
jgi:hypothetical protein